MLILVGPVLKLNCLFCDCDLPFVRALSLEFEHFIYPPSVDIFHGVENLRGMYIIFKGSMNVRENKHRKAMKAGDSLVHFALFELMQQPFHSEFTAVTDVATEIFYLSRWSFRYVFEKCYGFKLYKMQHNLSLSGPCDVFLDPSDMEVDENSKVASDFYKMYLCAVNLDPRILSNEPGKPVQYTKAYQSIFFFQTANIEDVKVSQRLRKHQNMAKSQEMMGSDMGLEFTSYVGSNLNYCQRMLTIPILSPDSNMVLFWNTLLLIITVYYLLSIPFRISFLQYFEMSKVYAVDALLDTLFIADIYLRMNNISFYESGRLCHSKTRIKEYYVKDNRMQFIYHVLAALPFEIFAVSGPFPYTGPLQTVYILRINKLLRILDASEQWNSLISVVNREVNGFIAWYRKISEPINILMDKISIRLVSVFSVQDKGSKVEPEWTHRCHLNTH